MIIEEYAEMECAHTTTTTFYRHNMNFFRHYYPIIRKLLDTNDLQYDPLDNYHGKEKRVRDRDQTVDTKDDKGWSESGKDDGDWGLNGSSNGTNTNYVSAFNDRNNDTEHHRDVSSDGYNREGDNHKTYSKSGTEDDVKKDTTAEDITDTIERSGNNGKPYQDLVEMQRKVAVFDIYDWIMTKWCKEMMIGVW